MQLFVVHVEAEKPLDISGDQTTIRLNESLFLVRSEHTQSQLYHSIKRKLDPEKLFVGVLADDPKFKGMADGALKWLRSDDG
jgi:hypothetical protein